MTFVLWEIVKPLLEIIILWIVFYQILVFFEGKEFRRFSKYVSIAELKDAVDRYYKMIF